MNINKYVLYKVYTKKVFLSFKACFPQGENNIEKKNSLAIKIWYKFSFGTVDYFKLICGTVRLFTYHMDPLLRSMEQLWTNSTQYIFV